MLNAEVVLSLHSYYLKIMTDKLNTLMDMLLDRARKAGADAADGIVAGGFGQEVSVRLEKASRDLRAIRVPMVKTVKTGMTV